MTYDSTDCRLFYFIYIYFFKFLLKGNIVFCDCFSHSDSENKFLQLSWASWEADRMYWTHPRCPNPDTDFGDQVLTDFVVQFGQILFIYF